LFDLTLPRACRDTDERRISPGGRGRQRRTPRARGRV